MPPVSGWREVVFAYVATAASAIGARKGKDAFPTGLTAIQGLGCLRSLGSVGGQSMRISERVTKTIGRTPLVGVRRIAYGIEPRVVARLKSFSPCAA